MPYRPLLFLSGLGIADYVLWNWSLAGNHAVLALVSGLTLPPLAVAIIWLLALGVVRIALARSSRRSLARAENVRIIDSAKVERAREHGRISPTGNLPLSEQAASTSPARAPSRRIAA